MAERFAKNRETVVTLIYSMGVFTKDDLIERLREERGREIAIDGDQTIGEYLGELTQQGTLRYEHGKFRVPVY